MNPSKVVAADAGGGRMWYLVDANLDCIPDKSAHNLKLKIARIVTQLSSRTHRPNVRCFLSPFLVYSC